MTTRPADRKISIVVASRDRRDELLANLPRHDVPVTLVDNGSADGTPDAVRTQLPAVKVIALPANVGAPARNIGVAAADTPYVAFADDDSWWADGALDRAVRILDQHSDIAVLCGRILVNAEDRLDPLCGEMTQAPIGLHPSSGHPLIVGFSACGAVVRRSAFLDAGGFDPVVFFPGEEERLVYDLLSGGWRLVYAEEVVAHHHPSPSRHGNDARMAAITRSALLTAVMRRPWRVVLERLLGALRQSAATRSGLRRALPSLVRAVRARRRPDPAVERTLAAVAAFTAGGPDVSRPVQEPAA